MCGIFGIISNKQIEKRKLSKLANRARQRGKDSSGLIYNSNKGYIIKRADFDIKNLLLKFQNQLNTSFVMGHSRLITNGLFDNQPIVRDGIVVIHNGIIVNEKEICEQLKFEKK